MASRQNLTIDVNINPNEQPGGAAVDVQETPNVANKPLNLRNIAAIGLIANAGRQIGMTTLGQVGAITGNAQTQRTISRFTNLAGIAGSFAINPLVGALTFATTMGTEVFTAGLKRRDETNSIQYYQKINGRRIDKGRMKWFIQ